MSVDFTHRGGEGERCERKKEEETRTYPVSEYGRWQHCGKQEGGEDGSLHFAFSFSFPFSSLRKLLFLVSRLEMNR